MGFEIEPYDPCPCGSGEKYKFCCAAKAKANRHGKFPIGTVAYYGPDDKTSTKIAAGVILRDDSEPILQRWVAADILRDRKIADEVKQFFAKYGVKNVVITDGVIGCPHEEGIDFPDGQDCPFCPFWKGKQGTARRDDLQIEELEEDEDDVFEGDEFADDDDEDGEFDDEETDFDVLMDRVNAIIADPDCDRDKAIDRLLEHLKANLQMPCEVTGIEDFGWEEPYVIGGWSPSEYKRLKKAQPSYRDRYQLLSLTRDTSEWMMFGYEDIAARVRRNSDGKLFTLGLAELKATDPKSPNYRLLDDYAVWFVNSR